MKNMQRRFKPYQEILKTFWENRGHLDYAWRILNHGVCDGCALGTSGMRDWTMKDLHLCWIRLNLLKLNTMPAMDIKNLANVASLDKKNEAQLRNMGRLPAPLIRNKGEAGFTPIEWDKVLSLIADRIKVTDPKKLAFYLVSRGTVNETYYVAQKVARFLGTNHIDNSARICHAPSTTGLKHSVGFAAATCSYKDWLGTDLLVFIGSDAANNQPVVMKYVHLARKKGTKVIVINPFREPAMEKYWVPSTPSSMLLGTKIADHFFQIKPGGDIALINGILKHLIANDWVDKSFIESHTNNWEQLKEELAQQNFAELEKFSGVSRETMLQFAKIYSQAKSAVFVWSMGVTMHRYGVENIKAIANLALSRAMIGRPNTGLVPIRGHSGVQGGAEMGAIPNSYPTGAGMGPEVAQKFEKLWGFQVPDWKGLFIPQIIEQAHAGNLDVLYAVGSNLLGVLPDRKYVKQAVEKIPLRIHQDIVFNPQMLLPPEETVILLPATTRYEMVGGNTETSTERRIIFNPEIRGPRIADARDEWRVLVDIAKLVKPQLADKISFENTSDIRQEIAKAAPPYQGIEKLRKKGDQIQWGGVRLGENNKFNTPDGKARFSALSPPQSDIPKGFFQLVTRRGMQFNSIIFEEKDFAIGADRDAVIMAIEDMQSLGLKTGMVVTVRSETGEIKGKVFPGPITQGSVVMYWPEANVLIRRGMVDSQSGIPAYRDEIVQVVS